MMTKLGTFTVALVAIAFALPAGAHADAGAAALKRCATPRSFTTGPFFADQVRARGVGCAAARRQVKRWGRTDDCVMPDGPKDRVCRTGRVPLRHPVGRLRDVARSLHRDGARRGLSLRLLT
jgi:hypothetical protein